MSTYQSAHYGLETWTRDLRAACGHFDTELAFNRSLFIGEVSKHSRGGLSLANLRTNAGLIKRERPNAALELATYQVRVNGVEPGMIATPAMDNLGDSQVNADIASRVPLGRLGAAQDIAGAMLFLASDLATYITGQTIVVDGGSTLPEVK